MEYCSTDDLIEYYSILRKSKLLPNHSTKTTFHSVGLVMDVCPITKSRKEKVDLLIDLFLVFLPLPKHFDFPRLEFKKLTSQLLSEPLLNQDHTFPIMHPLPNQVLNFFISHANASITKSSSTSEARIAKSHFCINFEVLE